MPNRQVAPQRRYPNSLTFMASEEQREVLLTYASEHACTLGQAIREILDRGIASLPPAPTMNEPLVRT